MTAIFCWSRVRASSVHLMSINLSRRMYLFLSGFRVTLGIYGFGNGIVRDFAISKVNVINTRVEDGIIMGTPNDVTPSILLVADYGSTDKGVAMWNHDGCLNILVPCLRSNLLLESGRSLVCLVVVQVWQWVLYVNESNFLKLSLMRQ